MVKKLYLFIGRDSLSFMMVRTTVTMMQDSREIFFVELDNSIEVRSFSFTFMGQSGFSTLNTALLAGITACAGTYAIALSFLGNATSYIWLWKRMSLCGPIEFWNSILTGKGLCQLPKSKLRVPLKGF